MSRIADNAIYLANCVRTKPICARLSRRRVRHRQPPARRRRRRRGREGEGGSCEGDPYIYIYIYARTRRIASSSSGIEATDKVRAGQGTDGALFSFFFSFHHRRRNVAPARFARKSLLVAGKTPRRMDDRRRSAERKGTREICAENMKRDLFTMARQAGSDVRFFLLAARYGQDGTSRER